MLPFALKVVWTVLSITGLASCWLVLSALALGVRSFWGPMTYCVACTILQLSFCIGMAWKMDPYLMPASFCIAQNILMSFSVFLLTGICAAFSIATCYTIQKPKLWGTQDLSTVLAWRRLYLIPVVIFPVLASIVQISVVVKLDAIQPNDDLHCDANDPEWVRFLGYAGTPLLLAIPSLFISIRSIVRSIKTTKHIQRSRSDELEVQDFTPAPRRLRSRRAPPSMVGRLHDPPTPPDTIQGKSYPQSNDSFDTTGSPSDLPNYANVQYPSTLIIQGSGHPDFSAVIGDPYHTSIDDMCPDDDTDDVSSLVWASPTSETPPPSDTVRDHGLEKEDLESAYIEFNDSGDMLPYSKHTTGVTGAPQQVQRKRTPPAFLSPTIWRLLVLQVSIVLSLLLATITTLIDVICGRMQPSSFGTHHVALLLAAWGPVIILGHLPVVRRKLIFWRRDTTAT